MYSPEPCDSGAACRIVAIEGPAEPGLALGLIRGLSAGQATVARLLSAGVLAGLLGISVWTLSTRVKSLDRLK